VTATDAAVPAMETSARRGHSFLRAGGPILALVALALLIRLAVILATPHFVPVTDGREYDQAAVSLVHSGSFPPSDATLHGGPSAYHPPLFSIVLAGVDELVGTGDAQTRWDAGRVLEALLGAVTVLLIGLIAQRLWDRRAGLAAAAIAAVYPPLILVGSSLMSESLFIPLTLAAVWAALRGRDSPHAGRWAVAAGILVGLAALTRGNGVLLGIAVALLLWTGRPRRARAALAAPAAVILATALTLVPWTVRNLSTFHRFVPVTTETGYALAGTYNRGVQHDPRFPALWEPPFAQVLAIDRAHPTASEAEISAHLTSRGLHYVGNHPGSVLRTVYWNTLRMAGYSPGFERYFARYEGYPPRLAQLSAYATWVLLALALAGAFATAARTAPRALWLWPLIAFVTAVVLEGTIRYRSPADPFLVLLAALALTDRRWRARGRAMIGRGKGPR
jgi:4-amino-4-deoxy-L-arabinose transferase-like glycosyltransferase